MTACVSVRAAVAADAAAFFFFVARVAGLYLAGARGREGAAEITGGNLVSRDDVDDDDDAAAAAHHSQSSDRADKLRALPSRTGVLHLDSGNDPSVGGRGKCAAIETWRVRHRAPIAGDFIHR